MSFISDSNEIARQLKQKRTRNNPALGKKIVIDVPKNVQLLTTAEAAEMLNRKPQTLRTWACASHMDDAPICPVRINGRLGWRVLDVQALLNGESE